MFAGLQPGPAGPRMLPLKLTGTDSDSEAQSREPQAALIQADSDSEARPARAAGGSHDYRGHCQD
jgi:hypothetical protein